MYPATTVRPIEILLVEDNPVDVSLTEELFAGGKITNKLHVAADGEQAMQFLQGEAPYPNAPKPDLILLDLNLPGKQGHEVLAEIKGTPGVSEIPVVVVTGSIAEEDFHRAYDLTCDGYMNKPVDLEDLFRVIRSIDHFGMTITTVRPNS